MYGYFIMINYWTGGALDKFKSFIIAFSS